jgi:ABC-type Mn2+/Zn2+ transport system ATPase subunit
MRITLIHITSEYKNLKDFKITFDGKNFIDVFVGKNGTGKSNFFEACLEIFKHIYEKDYPISFTYKLHYTIDDTEVEIEWKDGKWINPAGKEIALPPGKLLPDNILVYYSGHNTTIRNLTSKYEELHRDKINRNRKNKAFDQENTRRFLGIGAEYKSLLLSVMLLQSDDLNAKKFILEKLGIKSLGNEVKIILTRPEFAIGNNELTFDEVDATKRYWSSEGFFKDFLDKIWNVVKFDSKAVRDEGYINTEEREEYILYRDLKALQKEFKGQTALELFISLDNLKTIGLLKDISIEIELNSNKKLNLDQFSDGQFQSIYIYTVTELFKNKNCITLLDEPDSFLHPEWQFDFFKQIIAISAKSSESNHVLMTSHSAITLINHLNDKICFFDFKEDGNVHSYSLLKRVAINKLSSNLINYSEQDQILSIINTIQIENKPVLFTEGKTDPLIIKEAWNKLYPNGPEIPFIPFYAFGHKYLVQLMKDPEVIADMKGKPIFGLFDYDKAFNSWNGFSKVDISKDVHSGLIKQMDKNEVYAIMLPVPKGKPIAAQVINPDTSQTYGEHSLMAIEHLFCHIPELGNLFQTDLSLPSKFKRFQGDKVEFAKKTVPTLGKENFDVFQPMFDFIKSKCPK